MDSLDQKLADTAALIEGTLSHLLNNHAYPQRLHEAMRYAALNGGKRIRPFLVIETAKLFDVEDKTSLPVAAALECVHCYSLVHDDLPSMDDDTLRRGKPTLHIAYDEATAILAGDSLLTLAFEILSKMEIAPAISLQLVHQLSVASGAAGMAGGQMLDLSAEGRFGTRGAFDETQIIELQARKTGALLRYAARACALLGGANETQLESLTHYGEMLGILFQLADDLIDATGDASKEGKAVAKDAARGKATLIGLLGIEAARERLIQLAVLCEKELNGFDDAETLCALPRALAARAL
ncbi:MAG: farnesyl diphosphate synthase [Pseudomonadota bacterium]